MILEGGSQLKEWFPPWSVVSSSNVPNEQTYYAAFSLSVSESLSFLMFALEIVV